MCDRYALTSYPEDLARQFGASEPAPIRRGNVAPMQWAPIVRLDGVGVRRLANLRWGLVPGWAPDLSFGAICATARSETAATRPAFRAAIRRRRCLVPADAYYEWKVLKGRLQLHRVELVTAVPFAFAGLWESWQAPTGEVTETFAIITTAPASIHSRDGQPVILEPRDHGLWLDPAPAQFDRQIRLLRPLAPGRLRSIQVERCLEELPNISADELLLPTPEHRAA